MANLDSVTLVNQENIITGSFDKRLAHKYPVKLHRAVSVWLINSKNQVLLQKRSKKKILGAGWWGNAICGNVRSTESEHDCATRRLIEEIGVYDVKLKPIYQFKYRAYGNEQYGEHELDLVYVARYDGQCEINPHEVAELYWVDIKFLLRQIDSISLVNPVSTINMSQSELKHRTKPIKFQLSAKQVGKLAFWSGLMLKDDRLLKELLFLFS